MNILVLNGSPRKHGNTAFMIDAFLDGAKQQGHHVDVISVCEKNINGCLACEYCHTKGNGACIQQDDMQEIYPLLQEAEMVVLASPVYYHGFSGQLQCAINRIYALDKPKKLRKAALFLSSGSDSVYDGAIYAYENSFIQYLGLENMGIFKAYDVQNSPKHCGKSFLLSAVLWKIYLCHWKNFWQLWIAAKKSWQVPTCISACMCWHRKP